MDAKNPVTCADLGYACDMQPRLDCETQDVREMKTVPASGPDAREGDTWQVPTGRILRQEKKFTAYYECTHCHRVEYVGSKTVALHQNVTFEEILDEKKQQDEFQQNLAEFERQQAIARQEFIRENAPQKIL